MMRGAGHSRPMQLECLFCLKKVGVDRNIQECNENIFNSCFRHLPSNVIGEPPDFKDFQNNNGPFCALCFQSAQQLSKKSELLTIMEKEIGDFVTSLTVSILQNRHSPVNTLFEYESNIDIQILQKVQNYTLDIQVGSAGVFDCYEEEIQEDEGEKEQMREIVVTIENENEIQEIENLDEVQEIESEDEMQEIENLDEVQEIESEDEVQEIESEDEIENDDEVQEIENDDEGQEIENDDEFQEIENDDEVQEIENDDDVQEIENEDDVQEIEIDEQEDSRDGFASNVEDESEDGDQGVEQLQNCETGDQGTAVNTNQVVTRNIVLHKTPSGKVFLTIPCECGMPFESEKQMKEHSLSCPKANYSEASVIRKSDIRYRCGICGFLAKSIDELGTHKIRHAKKYECHTCKEKFRLKVQLKVHRKAVHRQQYKCSKCEKTFYSESLRMDHEDEHKANENGEASCKEKPNGRKCQVCGEILKSKTGLNYHMISKHSDQRPYECSVCHRTFKIKRFLQSHMQTHLQVKNFLCGDQSCGKSFAFFRLLEQHTKLEHTDDHFKCELCDFKTLDQKRIEIHKARYHDVSKQYECSFCGIRVSALSTLRSHERIHTGEKPHECDICGEKFRTQILLRLHGNRTHAEEKYKCSSCDYVAGAQFLLDSHSLVHSENKPFECNKCGKTFKVKSSMMKHERLTCKVQR